MQRQNTQLQNQVSKTRRISTASPSQSSDLEAQLASKTSTIESLELDISSIRSQLATVQESVNTKDAELTDIRSALNTAEMRASEAQQQISELQKQLEANAKDSSESSTLSNEAESRIALLTSQLSTSQRDASASASRIAALEKKAETLVTLHKDATARHQSHIDTLATENAKLKRDASARSHTSSSIPDPSSNDDGDGDDAALDALENESRTRLESHIRQLEAENSELRRGIWRNKRTELQPGMDTSDGGPQSGFDEVDLNSAGGFLSSPLRSASGRGTTQSPYRGTSTFTEVLNSGISAFTGQPTPGRRRQSSKSGLNAGAILGQGMGRRESVGDEALMEDDDFGGFDEGAFAKAREEEDKARLERVREVKRGLEGWRGWRVDLVDLRGGVGVGVFDV